MAESSKGADAPPDIGNIARNESKGELADRGSQLTGDLTNQGDGINGDTPEAVRFGAPQADADIPSSGGAISDEDQDVLDRAMHRTPPFQTPDPSNT
ncbi:MAG TPA: hypothetical protein VGT61_15170 [Thermomicrobiales bacterium]|nr:hypothetical protein [Thermomicrobiales bacterium]